jgi:hypothetical protein
LPFGAVGTVTSETGMTGEAGAAFFLALVTARTRLVCWAAGVVRAVAIEAGVRLCGPGLGEMTGWATGGLQRRHDMRFMTIDTRSVPMELDLSRLGRPASRPLCVAAFAPLGGPPAFSEGMAAQTVGRLLCCRACMCGQLCTEMTTLTDLRRRSLETAVAMTRLARDAPRDMSGVAGKGAHFFPGRRNIGGHRGGGRVL